MGTSDGITIEHLTGENAGETRGIEPDGVHITRTYAFNPQISGRPYKMERPEKIDGTLVTIDGKVYQTRDLEKGFREVIGCKEPTLYWTGIDNSSKRETNTPSMKGTPTLFDLLKMSSVPHSVPHTALCSYGKLKDRELVQSMKGTGLNYFRKCMMGLVPATGPYG